MSPPQQKACPCIFLKDIQPFSSLLLWVMWADTLEKCDLQEILPTTELIIKNLPYSVLPMTRKYSSFLINAYGRTCSENKLSLVIAERILQKHLTVTPFWEFAFSYLLLAWYDGERGNVILPKVQAFLMLHYNHKEIEMK